MARISQTRNRLRGLIFVLTFVSVLGSSPIALGQALSPPKGYLAYLAKTPVVVDGKLDDASWNDAPWTDDFVDIEGDKKPRPRFQTRVKMLWDDNYFYIAAELKEPHVWGTLTKHDSVIFQDNDFEVFIDPDGDTHNYYELEINALNTEWDLFLTKAYRDGGPAVDKWEVPGLKTATHVYGTLNDPSDVDTAWTVEWALPWKALGEFANKPSPPKDGDQWRVNFSRVEWEHLIENGQYKKVPKTPEANWVWSAQGFVDMHRPETWGFVQFVTAEPGKGVFKADPSEPVRERLMKVYWAQKLHHKTHKRWSTQPEELDPEFAKPLNDQSKVEIKATESGYEASITLKSPEPVVWTIREDSKLSPRR